MNYETQIDFCEECDGLWFDAGELKEALQIIKATAPTTKTKRRPKSSSKETVETLMAVSQADTGVIYMTIRLERASNALRLIQTQFRVTKQVVEITKDLLSFQHGLLGLQKNIPIEDLAQIFVVKKYTRGSEGTAGGYSYSLYALKKNGKRLRILQGCQKKEVALELEEKIEDFLDIGDEKVSTSLYQKFNCEFALHEFRYDIPLLLAVAFMLAMTMIWYAGF